MKIFSEVRENELISNKINHYLMLFQMRSHSDMMETFLEFPSKLTL